MNPSLADTASANFGEMISAISAKESSLDFTSSEEAPNDGRVRLQSVGHSIKGENEMTVNWILVGAALFGASMGVQAGTLQIEVNGASIPVEVAGAYVSGRLLLSGPAGTVREQILPAGNGGRLALAAGALEDGHYRYRIDFAGTATTALHTVVASDGRAGAVPIQSAPAVVEGGFRIVHGRMVLPGLTESESPRVSDAGVTSAQPAASGPVPNDQVIADDLIVQGSICAGLDCVLNESFGFDTLRLKENNTRIAFADTSVAPFPANHWQLTANDAASGGANKFSIEDITAATIPFTVSGASPTNALFVDAGGRLGLGTATPVLHLQVSDGNTPGMRLEQTAASGFSAQTWDVSGNEANFFVRDITNGSRLPFRIRPGAPTSSIDIAATGNVGIGTASPAAKLDVSGDAIIRGTLSQLSSRTAKENFVATDGKLMLAKLEKLPISTWNYRGAAGNDRHLGPVAEDFHDAFGLGPSDHFVAPTDMAGVALASVQALQQEIKDRDQRIADLENRLRDLEVLVRSAAK